MTPLTTPWLANPLHNALFMPTAARWGGLLLIALAGILIVTRHKEGKLRDDELFIRWRTWAFIAPIFLFGILGGALPRLLLITGLILQGLREYANLVGLPTAYRRILYGMAIIVPPVAFTSLEGFYLMAPLLLILATLQPLLLGKVHDGVRHMAFAAFGWGYLAWFLGHAVLIQQHIPGGLGIILTLGLAVAMSDVGAFTMGKAFGRHKLSPRLSPNKTIEGVLGNFIGAYAGVLIMSFALPESIRAGAIVGLPLLVAIGSLWGDLVESALKREFGVKDSGAWLPGFGGILDRIDSLIIVLPLAYYALRLLA
jgi:phosphatidate cytidylyltransferase